MLHRRRLLPPGGAALSVLCRRLHDSIRSSLRRFAVEANLAGILDRDPCRNALVDVRPRGRHIGSRVGALRAADSGVLDLRPRGELFRRHVLRLNQLRGAAAE